MMSKQRKPAFTLIELLVVVAIVALLISLLLPSLAQARVEGRKAVCMSNMRQIVAAVRMYVPDNSDWYPPTMETVSAALPTTISWWAIDNYQKSLEPYMQQDRGGVNAEAQSQGRRSVWFDPGDPDAAIDAMWGSFSDNGLITGVPRRDSQIRRASETVYSTLRHADWSHVVGVAIPAPLPVENPDDPFWVSEFFDMCFDPWSEDADPANPYHWTQGKALPPNTLFPTEPQTGAWDQQIDGRFPGASAPPRYGSRQPYAFCDGHVAFMPFEATYAFPAMNMWDIE